MTETNLQCLTGGVEGVVYYNEDSGYIVLDMDVDGELITAVGNMGDVREGEQLTLYGEYITNAKYGRQLILHIYLMNQNNVNSKSVIPLFKVCYATY